MGDTYSGMLGDRRAVEARNHVVPGQSQLTVNVVWVKDDDF
jgi:hypothetical protein